MDRKGMSMTLTVVVTAIIILIIALVLITIFSGAITPIGSIAQAKNNCKIQGQSTCSTTGSLPATWEIKSLKVADSSQPASCYELWTCKNCAECQAGWQTVSE